MDALGSLATQPFPWLGTPRSAADTNETNAHLLSPTQVGQEFEGLFLSMMLKELRASLDQGLFQGDGGDVYGSLFDLMLGKSLAESSPLGISRQVQHYLERVPALPKSNLLDTTL